METIIHQIATKFIEQVLGKLSGTGIGNIGQTIAELLPSVNAVVLEIVGAAIREADDALVAATHTRKADGLRVKERGVPRAILTCLGELRYERTYFETRSKDRCYLIDRLIGVEAYERISKELCASLVQAAAGMSMEKSAKGGVVQVSRQTVDNKVLALKEVAAEAKPARETPGALHIFADEDHVHMKGGRNAIVPLVTVTEGIDAAQKRHKTINPMHFTGYGISPGSFFEGISSSLYEMYSMGQVKTVYVHADGGQWIQAAHGWLPNVKFVADGFHVQRRLKHVSRLKGAAAYMGTMRKSIRDNDLGRFASCCAKIREMQGARGRELLGDNEGFIRNHWDAIVLRMSGEVCGSCTEPLVSHVLSWRLSRNPLAWSEHGIRQMAMLRVYVANGGVIKAGDIRVSRGKDELGADKKTFFLEGFAKYRAYADKQIGDTLNPRRDWGIFSGQPFHYGKLDGTAILLKAWGTSRDVLSSA